MKGYCFNCMQELENDYERCPHCGQETAAEVPPHQLRPGTVLKERYLLGTALGQGGFGITYLGRDLHLNMRVAVKEFYPTGFANRNHDASDVVSVSDADQELFLGERDKFLKEAKTLALFFEEPGIVSVLDFFEKNNTAYIVMEYLDGMTLKSYLAARGPIPADELLMLMRPLIVSLNKVHRRGIIHRDISPDNIMLMPDGRLKLLDFGAAREVGGDKSLSVMLKPGFAPVEQYRTRGSQGPWTDVYALCATMYYCLTGRRPEESIERAMNSNSSLTPPSQLGVEISPAQERALLHGMAVRAADRYQNMAELAQALYASPEAEPEPADEPSPAAETEKEPEPEEEARSEMIPKPTVSRSGRRKLPILLAVALLAGGLAFGISRMTGGRSDAAITAKAVQTAPQAAVPETEVPALTAATESAPVTPTAEELSYTEAEALLASGRPGAAALAFQRLNDYSDARDRASAAWIVARGHHHLAAGDDYSMGLRADGIPVRTDGVTDGPQRDVIEIAAGWDAPFCLLSNGRVVPATSRSLKNYRDVTGWSNVVSMAASSYALAALRSDGTVRTAGQMYDLKSFQNWADETADWTDIVAVAAGWSHIVGLRADGTVVAAGINTDGQCDVDGWQDIVAIAAGGFQTIGVRADGSCVFAGKDLPEPGAPVSEWTDITAAACGYDYAVGLKSDGSCIYAGANWSGTSVEDWPPVVEISAGRYHALGLTADGTVVTAGPGADRGGNSHGQYNVQQWTNIGG